MHEEHYKSTSGLIERLDIAKMMLMQEGNLQGKFKGKSLEDISFEGKYFFHGLTWCDRGMHYTKVNYSYINLSLYLSLIRGVTRE